MLKNQSASKDAQEPTLSIVKPTELKLSPFCSSPHAFYRASPLAYQTLKEEPMKDAEIAGKERTISRP